jgi:hypothetical protein
MGGDLTTSHKYTLRWLARQVPGFWTGVPWRLWELLDKFKWGPQRRMSTRDRVLKLESAGHVVYLGGGKYRLSRLLQRTTGSP